MSLVETIFSSQWVLISLMLAFMPLLFAFLFYVLFQLRKRRAQHAKAQQAVARIVIEDDDTLILAPKTMRASLAAAAQAQLQQPEQPKPEQAAQAAQAAQAEQPAAEGEENQEITGLLADVFVEEAGVNRAALLLGDRPAVDMRELAALTASVAGALRAAS